MTRPSKRQLLARALCAVAVAVAAMGACTGRDLPIGQTGNPMSDDAAIMPPVSDASIDLPQAPIDAHIDLPQASVDAHPDVTPALDVPPSICSVTGPGLSDCGPNNECCAVSPLVPGGSFFRSYDGVVYSDDGNPATVSSFRLDKYEVTVGRFRQFVAAVIGGWRPVAGLGKHTHLNGGEGLSDNSGAPDGLEIGWGSGWNNNLPTTAAGWNATLACDGLSTWTASPTANENMPVSCLNWYQAYAFCMWDGGFLPSEAEWNYAASGGDEQRAYPWSSPPSALTIDCSYANYSRAPGGGTATCNSTAPLANPVGRDSPKGDGRWGQADLAGNLSEWTLDWYVLYANPCVDCAYLTANSQPVSDRLQRGGTFWSSATGTGTQTGTSVPFVQPSVLAASRVGTAPSARSPLAGARCARAP